MTHTRRGFTIIEMVIVIGMIGLMATIVVVSLTGVNEGEKVESAWSVMTADIRSVISWSQSGKLEATTDSLPEGYGIVFVTGSNTYTVYAEFSGNRQYGASEGDVVVKTVNLEIDELISDVIVSGCSPAVSGSCDLYVEGPGGDLFTNGTLTTDLLVALEQTRIGDTASFSVDLSSGLID